MFAVSWCMLPVYLSAQPLEVESFSALHLFLFVYILSTSMGPITSWLIFVKGILMEVCKYIELWFMLEGLISWVRNWKVLQLMGTSALGDLQELAVIQWISWKKLELSRVPSISAVASRSWGFTSTLTLQWPLFFFFFLSSFGLWEYNLILLYCRGGAFFRIKKYSFLSFWRYLADRLAEVL